MSYVDRRKKMNDECRIRDKNRETWLPMTHTVGIKNKNVIDKKKE